MLGIGIDEYLLDFPEEQESGNIFINQAASAGVEEIWFDNNNINNQYYHQQPQQQQPQPGVNNDMLFMGFPFPCMSSSSSTSSTPAALIPAPVPMAPPAQTGPIISPSSSSTAASWAMNKSTGGGQGGINFDLNHLHAGYTQYGGQHFGGEAPAAVSMDVFQTEENREIYNMDCLNQYGMENYGFMDLMMDSSNQTWDPSSLLNEIETSGGGEDEVVCFDKTDVPQPQPQPPPPHPHPHAPPPHGNEKEPVIIEDDVDDEITEEDLGEVFFDWLKSNKEHISHEDIQKIKLNKASIESASKRLGKKQLLKLILEMVGQYQFQKPNNIPQESDMSAAAAAAAAAQMTYQTAPNHYPHHPPPPPNPNIVPTYNFTTTTPSPWMPPQQPYAGAYMVDPYLLNHPHHHPMDPYHPTWQPGQYIPASNGGYAMTAPGVMTMAGYSRTGGVVHQVPQQQYSYNHHYNYPRVNNVVTKSGGSSSSAFSYATKEARLKRRERKHKRNQKHAQQRPPVINESQTIVVPAPANFVAIPKITTRIPQPFVPVSVDDTEGGLKFLVKKVLKQSDASLLGRIVLPKRDAEAHLPALKARNGIMLYFKDMVNSHMVWKMRYRFWPNNKSRMYILECTGEYVQSNGLKEGDIVMIYINVKSGTYMIRCVKASQKSELAREKLLSKSYYNKPSTSYQQPYDHLG